MNFVKGALFCVTSCRFGISDTELVDVLSQHEGIMAEVNQYYKSSRISLHVWTKFKSFFNEQCSEIFIEQRSNCCWNSQQIRRIAESRYSSQSSNAADQRMFRDLHRVLGLYFGWGSEHSKQVDNLERFAAIPKLPAVHGRKNDVAAWFPDNSNLINTRRFQECAYHLLMAAGKKQNPDDQNALILYNLAYDELFGMTPIICCCILGIGSDLLCHMEDFKKSPFFNDLPKVKQDRAAQYLLFFSSNFQSIVLHPRRELLATATETFAPLALHDHDHFVRNDAFAVVRGNVSAKSDEIGAAGGSNSVPVPQLPEFPQKSFPFLSRLFSPPIAELMQWPSTLPEHLVSAMAISPCCNFIVCLDASFNDKLSGNQMRGQAQFRVFVCRSGEATFIEKDLEIDHSLLRLVKHIALFPAVGRPHPLLACAVGTKVTSSAPRAIPSSLCNPLIIHLTCSPHRRFTSMTCLAPTATLCRICSMQKSHRSLAASTALLFPLRDCISASVASMATCTSWTHRL